MRTIKDAELFNALREYFKVYLPKQKQVSPNTIRSYQNALESLLDYIVKTIPIKLNEVTFDTIDKEIVCNYLDWLENECNCSKSTRNHRLRCIKAFYAFVADTIPTAAIYQKEIYKIRQAPVEKSTKLDYMSEEAVKAVLSAPDLNTSKGIRDALIMIMLYDTGARIQETLAIKLCDIQYRSATVTLSGKGRKVRCVTLMDSTMKHLHNYIRLFHSDSADSDYLFFTNRKMIKKQMTTDNARRIVRYYGIIAREKCNAVPENVHPHLFRHSRAMHLYQNGMPLALISQWLGHSSVETTLIYAYADTEMKRKAIESATPPDSPLNDFLNAERYTISDEELIKQLYGLR